MFDPSANHRHILIIDDNNAIHEDFRKILLHDDSDQQLAAAEQALFGESQTVEMPKFTLAHAVQGDEGVAMVARALEDDDPFQMAFVDMRMPPGWDGLRTIEELWRVDPELEVVICSAYSDHSWSEIAERLGWSHHLLILRKPFDNIEVLQMSLALTEKRHASRVAAMRMNQICELVASRTELIQREKQEAEAMLLEVVELVR